METVLNDSTEELIRKLRLMTQVNGSIDEKEANTFIFCFLLIGYLEKAIEKTLYEGFLDNLKPEARSPEIIDLIFKEQTFGQKIDVFEFMMKDSPHWEKDKDLIKLCKTINYGIRNSLFHFKLRELKYKDLDVADVKTQNLIINDLIAAESKIKEN